MGKTSFKYRDQLGIAFLAALLFIPFLGGVHLFDWDEINFAECAREMIVRHDYLNVQIGFKPFWEKPPLFIWMQVLSMKAFGINEFAARFPNAVCGIVSLLLVYNIGKKLFDSKFGLWWVAVYAGSILPHFYFRSGIIDPWFNLLMFIAIWFFFKLHLVETSSGKRRLMYASLWGLFTGLAILTKGPTALLIVGLVTGIAYLPYILNALSLGPVFRIKSARYILRFSDITIFLFFTLLIGSSWFIAQILTGHSDMVFKFILYQVRLFVIPDAGHGGPWFYHVAVLFFGVFLASLFALLRFRKSGLQSETQAQFHGVMLILFWVVLILFSIVKTKIVHYSSLCYFPLTFFATVAINDLVKGELRWKKWLSIMLIAISLLFASITFALPLIDSFKQKIIQSGLIKDDFAIANLQANVHWIGFEGLIGLILVFGIIFAVIVRKKNPAKGLKILFMSSTIFIWLLILVFPYKIEQYSQGAVIEFLQSKSAEKCYIFNSGYFSYAPLFYARQTPDDIRRPMWLLTGKIDRPFYLILKEPEYRQWKQIIPAMQLLYVKNGFVFLVRRP